MTPLLWVTAGTLLVMVVLALVFAVPQWISTPRDERREVAISLLYLLIMFLLAMNLAIEFGRWNAGN